MYLSAQPERLVMSAYIPVSPIASTVSISLTSANAGVSLITSKGEGKGEGGGEDDDDGGSNSSNDDKDGANNINDDKKKRASVVRMLLVVIIVLLFIFAIMR